MGFLISDLINPAHFFFGYCGAEEFGWHIEGPRQRSQSYLVGGENFRLRSFRITYHYLAMQRNKSS